MKRWQGLVEEFKDYLPVNEDTPKLTLNEGHTPLIHCANISEMLDIDLYVKYEGANPTGSFKDRGMVMAVTKAKEQGKKVVAILTGNGLKDPDTAISILDTPIQPLPNNKESIINYIKGTL